MAHREKKTVSIITKVFAGILGAVGLVSGAAMYQLENSFLSHPRQPQPENGYTVAYLFKGVVFYITQSERDWIKVIYISFWVCLVLIFIFGIYYNKKMGVPPVTTKAGSLLRELNDRTDHEN